MKLDKINVGGWFSKQFAKLIAADKNMVQKSGYFARSAAPNADDLTPHSEHGRSRGRSRPARRARSHRSRRREGRPLRAVEFPRIKGGKPFNIDEPWFGELSRRSDSPRARRLASDTDNRFDELRALVAMARSRSLFGEVARM